MVLPQKQRLSVDEIKRAAAGRWCDILASVCGLSTEQLDPKRHQPCPRCGGTDRFRALDDVATTGGVWCGQCHHGETQPKAGDGLASVRWLCECSFPEALALVAGAVGLELEHFPATDKFLSAEFIERCQLAARDRLQELAGTLRVSADALLKLGVGWWAKERCWTFPERDARGAVLGLNRRFADGTKRLFKGHARGLTFADNWHEGYGPVLLVEGASDVAAGVTAGLCVIGRPMAQLPRKLADELAAMLKNLVSDRAVLVLGERDLKADGQWPGRDGALQSARLLMERLNRPIQWALPGGQSKDLRCWFADNPGATADDFIAALVVADVPQQEATASTETSRPRVELRLDERATCDEVVGVIAADPELFTMRQSLVRLVATDCGQLRPLVHDENSLRNLIAGRCDFFVMTPDKNAAGEDVLVPKPSRVQPWVYRGVQSRGEWPGVRPLVGVINRPALRPDGSVADVPGYDAATRLFLDLRGEWPRVPEHPSYEAARAAASQLLDVIADFPFADDASRAGWMCGVLTPLARSAYAGATGPLFAIDANTRGSGKSLLAELVAQIVTGDSVARMITRRDGDEMRKAFTAALLSNSGGNIVCFDNVVHPLGGEALDALLTADTWTDRELGSSRQLDIPARVTWLASGNNLQFTGDMERRVCRIRLESQEEHPEERSGFRFPDVVAHVRRHRRELVAAALTMLRGFVVAGRPPQNLPPWGSFEGWSDLVRQAVAWVGIGDAGAGRAAVRLEAEDSICGLVAVMDALAAEDASGHGLTAKAMLDLAQESQSHFAEAVAALCDADPKKTTARQLGNRLRKYKGRNISGRMLNFRSGAGRERFWFVADVRATPAFSSDSVTLSDSLSNPPTREERNSETQMNMEGAGNSVTCVTSVTLDPDLDEWTSGLFQRNYR